MFSIKAVSIAPTARDWLLNSDQPRFLHVFDHACNLINERGEILSIVTLEIGNGPFNLVIEEGILFSNHLDVRSIVSVGPGNLSLGHLKINIDDSEVWCSRPDWQSLHAKRDEIFNQLKRLPITDYQSLVSDLSSAVASANISIAKTIIYQLAGLGIGLTPAGDDFILGSLLAAWIIHPEETAIKIAKEITETAAPLTTSLSAAWLRSAGRGEAGILWHELFDAMIIADAAQIQEAMEKILGVGETSGADALSGFIGAFISWAKFVNPKPLDKIEYKF
jgi:hypothetical protein